MSQSGAISPPEKHWGVFPVRKVIFGTLLPAIFIEIGAGALAPLIVARGTSLGALTWQAALLMGAPVVGAVIANIPASTLASKYGDRVAMMLGAGLSALSFTAISWAPNVIIFALALFGSGAAGTVFGLARHAYLTRVTPPANRARVLSTLAGVHRIGYFLGPLIGAAILHWVNMTAVFLLGIGTSLAALAVVAVANPRGEAREEILEKSPWRGVMRSHGQVLARMGLAVALTSCVRGVRMIALPVWAEYVGIGEVEISLVFAVSSGIDMLLFYPAGKIMDRYGRLWTAVPSMLLLGTSLMFVPLTQTATELGIVAMVMGLANGLGSGIMMTLGSDTAPDGPQRSAYLALWRLGSEVGGATAPLLVSGAAALGLLSGGIVLAGGSGIAAAAALAYWTPRFSDQANKVARRPRRHEHPHQHPEERQRSIKTYRKED